MAMRLVLRTHPADSTLLEVMLEDEQGRENRVARAPLADPRAWEWTTPPSWLRRESVEALIDYAVDLETDGLTTLYLAKKVPIFINIDGPRLPGVKALQEAQKTALASMHDALTLCTVGPTGVIE